MTKRHPLSALLAVSVALACVCPALAQERAQAPQSLNGASIRIKTAEEKEILCKAKDLHIILYEPQGSSARLIFTHAEEVNGTFQKIRYKKLSGDEAYDAKEHKGTPALLTFNAVKGSVYHVSVEGGFWTSSSSEVGPAGAGASSTFGPTAASLMRLTALTSRNTTQAMIRKLITAEKNGP